MYLPSTPKAAPPLAPAASEGPQTPGRWRHPQLAEIVRRQAATTFDEKNVTKLVWNVSAFILMWLFGNTLKSYSRQILTTNHVYSDASVFIFQLFFIFNCAMALSPLFRAKDELLDIALSPTQRSLLGLDPAATPPATPGTTFVTPPKYRLSTSRNNSPASKQGSPLSASANASYSERRPSIGTPFSPVSSPLLYKAVSNGGNTNRDSFQRQNFESPSHHQSFGSTSQRQSFGSSSQLQGFGSPSPLTRSNSFGESTFSLGSFGGSLGPGTPSPLAGKRTSVGMPNKWLYERARRLSASGGAM